MNSEITGYIIPGFKHTPGVHCTSSALRNIFDFNGFKISEAMLFGLGSGMGLGYLKTRGMKIPMLGGRQYKFEDNLSQLLNIGLNKFTTKKPLEGWERLRSHLEQKNPCAINVDMGYLDYRDLPEDYHFGQHAIVICGYNSKDQTVLVADTDIPELQIISVDMLTTARNSMYSRFMSPYNLIYEMNFPNELPDFVEIIPKSIQSTGKQILAKSRFMKILGIYNGLTGLIQFSKDILKWSSLSNKSLGEHGTETAGFISDYGTGGGLFRYLFSKFLMEASNLSNDDQLAELSSFYRNLGDQWERVSKRFRILGNQSPGAALDQELHQIQDNLEEIIVSETQGAEKLQKFNYK